MPRAPLGAAAMTPRERQRRRLARYQRAIATLREIRDQAGSIDEARALANEALQFDAAPAADRQPAA